MGFSPRMYEIHFLYNDECEDSFWDCYFTYETIEEASKWYNRYKSENINVRIVETKIVRAFEDGKEYT